MSFEEFMRIKKLWMKNITCKWIIQGHLQKDSALELVKIAEEALSANKISEDNYPIFRCVKMRDRTLYTATRHTESETNPNSACFSVFAVCESRNRDKAAVLN